VRKVRARLCEVRALLRDVVYTSVAALNGSTGSHLIFTGSLDESGDANGADSGGGGCDDVAMAAFFLNFKFLWLAPFPGAMVHVLL
jgi:hypothetical protein